jgi:hypothetical protein
MDIYDSLHKLILLSVFNAGKNITYQSSNCEYSYKICKKVLQNTNMIPLEIKNDTKEIVFINGSKISFKNK